MIPRKRQSKSVTIAYASIASIILLVIIAIALIVVPPSPPSVAEFAPQAQEQIVQAPNQQSSQFGSGAGSCAAGQVCEGSDAVGSAIAPPKKVIEKARVRRCVGDPPRQTEDPQSPPCVNYWEGNNGGATSKGVSRDEIRVAVAQYNDYRQFFDTFVDFFNRRFEFYGRQLRLLPLPVVDYSTKPADMRAAAERADVELHSFAATSWDHQGLVLNPSVFYNELSRRGIVSTDHQSVLRSSRDIEQWRPYQWSFSPTLDELQGNLGEMSCKSLVGRSASHAGPILVTKLRKFAIIVNVVPGVPPPDMTPLQQTLERCGSGPVRIVEFSDRTQLEAIFADFRLSDITSISCPCSVGFEPMLAASDSGYQPEWITTGIFVEGFEFVYRAFSPPDQVAHLFGLGGQNKILPITDRPSYWATKEQNPQTSQNLSQQSAIYSELLLLAAGIQMAGPHLTPETFEQGLFRTRFPNPGAGGPPYWQARVGFGPGDHTMIDDLPLLWWSERAHGYDEGTGGAFESHAGGFCYIDGGARHSPGGWPERQHPFFDQTKTCR